MGEWQRVAWHLGGVTFDEYLSLSMYDRWVMHDELSDLIDLADPKTK